MPARRPSLIFTGYYSAHRPQTQIPSIRHQYDPREFCRSLRNRPSPYGAVFCIVCPSSFSRRANKLEKSPANLLAKKRTRSQVLLREIGAPYFGPRIDRWQSIEPARRTARSSLIGGVGPSCLSSLRCNIPGTCQVFQGCSRATISQQGGLFLI